MSVLRRAKELLGTDIVALDGHVGKIGDLVFDPLVWTVQYAVVRLAGFLGGVKLLVPREVIKDKKKGYLELSVSRQELMSAALHEVRDLRAAGWQTASDSGRRKQLQLQPDGEERITGVRTALDPNMRLAKGVIGYRVRAADGDVGRVRDFIINPATWIILCVIASTRVWLPGKRILLPVPWIDDINRDEHRVGTHLNRRDLRGAPRFNRRRHLTMEHIDNLFPYYADPKQRVRE
jgi:hypothetical protein